MVGVTGGKHRSAAAPHGAGRLVNHSGRYGWLWLTALIATVSVAGSDGVLRWLAVVMPTVVNIFH